MNNYHTHTNRCRHADGDVADYLEEARAAGLGELGFSDHTPLPDDRWQDTRMAIAELPSYIEAIETAKRGETGRENPVRIIAGMECECVPEYENWFREELLDRLGLEYLVAGMHYYLHRGVWEDTYSISGAARLVSFARHSQRAMASGLFAFLAHPDVFCYSWLPWDANAIACARDILGAAEDTGVPLEINGYGMRKARVPAPEGLRLPYPHEEFWRLASGYKIRVVVNSDAHRPRDVAANLEDGRDLARRHGLTVMETLDLRAIRR